nr:hypothetical protein [Tanacetum cinerariifolium]
GVDCLPNEEIFAELARMGYEKPSTKLTFYKAFFSSKWKFHIHTISQCMRAKITSRNEFSSSMASAVICLSSGDLSTHTTKYTSPALTQKVFANIKRVGKGFSGVETPLFESMLVEQQVDKEGDADENVEEVNVGDAAEGDVQPLSPQPQPQPPQDAEFPMNLLQEVMDTCVALTRRVDHLEFDKLERRNKVRVLKLRRLQRVGTSQRVETSDETVMDDVSDQGRMTTKVDVDAYVVLKDDKEVADEAKEVADVVKDVQESSQDQGRQAEFQAEIYKIDMDHANKVLSMQEDESEPAEVQEVVDVVTTAKLITEVVTTASKTVTVASAIITAAKAQVPAVTLTAALARVAAAPSRRRKGVVIKDPEEESTTSTIISAETK